VVLTINVPFPVLTMGLMWRLVLTHLHHLLLMVALIVFLRIEIRPQMLLLVPGIALIYLNGLWMTTLIGMICLRFRDLQMIVTISMQIAQFVTPVFWPVRFISPSLEWVVHYNPLFHMLELIRNPLIGEVPTVENWIWCLAMLLVGSTTTLVVYALVRNRMAYWY
jgi:ABC-type polysaccharide/polyol phosphate export permease